MWHSANAPLHDGSRTALIPAAGAPGDPDHCFKECGLYPKHCPTLNPPIAHITPCSSPLWRCANVLSRPVRGSAAFVPRPWAWRTFPSLPHYSPPVGDHSGTFANSEHMDSTTLGRAMLCRPIYGLCVPVGTRREACIPLFLSCHPQCSFLGLRSEKSDTSSCVEICNDSSSAE